jgi:hypothetical protein
MKNTAKGERKNKEKGPKVWAKKAESKVVD